MANGKRDQRHRGEMKDGMPNVTAKGPGGGSQDPPERSEAGSDAWWLDKARDAYEYTSDWMSSGMRSRWEDSMARFNNRHPSGSKFNQAQYQKRNKHFRPKTRANARRLEARTAAAIFTNPDVVVTQAQNRNSREGEASARLGKELLRYRLEHSIPWFLTCLGAIQDTFNYGVTVSRTGWSYERIVEKEYEIPTDPSTGTPFYDEDGNILGEEIEVETVVDDRPEVTMIAPENFRFDPNADWRDPVGTSPVLIELIPMYAGEVLERMSTDVEERYRWNEYSLGEIIAAGGGDKEETENVRAAREGRDRTDSRDTTPKTSEFEPVWVHLNTVKWKGRDYSYYTLGTTKMLTKPEYSENVIPLGRDAYTLGISVIEAHKSYPAGGNELGGGLQEAINHISNQRFDNVELVLNKRHLVRRNSAVDLAALARNVPGGSVFTGDIEKDVKIMETPDVTGSSYQEQDRAAVEMDELLGAFSGSSVQSNRALNETVGGMQMMQGDANNIGDYEIRTFIETWVEPTLRKLYKLIAMFETDATVFAVAGGNADLHKRYGIDRVTDQLIDRDLVVSVNVAMGNTDPVMRVQRLSMGMQAVSVVPDLVMRIKGEEVGKEVFSSLGFGDGSRFLKTDEELVDEANNNLPAEEEAPDTSLQVAQIRAQVDRERNMIDRELGMARLAMERELTLEELYTQLGIKEKERQDKRDIAAVSSIQKRRDQDQHEKEMQLRRETGAGV